METEGSLAPESVDDARAAFDAVGPTAKQVVREVAKAMEFDREEYHERVTPAVVERARNVLFADRLAVTVDTREAFDAWVDEHPGYEVTLFGSDDVDRVVWHAAPFAEAVVAATFHEERDAAVGTLRRQAFSRIYRPRFEGDSGGEDTDGTADDPNGDVAGGDSAAGNGPNGDVADGDSAAGNGPNGGVTDGDSPNSDGADGGDDAGDGAENGE